MNITYIITTYPLDILCTRRFDSLVDALEYVRIQVENEVKMTIEYDNDYHLYITE
jgi:hypothetical protein